MKDKNKLHKFSAMALSVLLVSAFLPVSSYADPQNLNEAGDFESDGSSTEVEQLDGNNEGYDEGKEGDEYLPETESDVSGRGGDFSALENGMSDEEIEEFLAELEGDAATSMLSRSTMATTAVFETFAGDTRFDTAALQARAAFSACDTAIVIGDGGWPDALSAAGLAGALDCPILFTGREALHPSTASALTDLGVSKVIAIGGDLRIGDQVIKDIRTLGLQVERIWDWTAYATQMAVYQYGVKNSLWGGETIIVATGTGFADALSIAPVAFVKKAPIFLVDESKDLSSVQKEAIVGFLNPSVPIEAILLGGPLAVSERIEGFLDGAVRYTGGKLTHLAGETRFDTSSMIAEWAVSKDILKWDKVAFTTSGSPYDALAGSILQGKTRSSLLLVGDTSSSTIASAAANKESISSVRFFGGELAMPKHVTTYILDSLGLVDYSLIAYRDYAISLDTMAKLETSASQGQYLPNYSYSEILEYLDPSQFEFDEDDFYQFAVLSEGYSGKVSADQLNRFIDRQVAYRESELGVRSVLRGTGDYFIKAAQLSGVNEVYLLAHAALESGWGTSNLARGVVAGYAGYYNLFGIGAYDGDAEQSGAMTAKTLGWNSIEAAILGSAEWIADGVTVNNKTLGFYFHNEWNQNTLYKMRWNVAMATSIGKVWKQYATARTWATGIASVMGDFYRISGIRMQDSGLRFEVPRYTS